ncbi:hypothetical protein PR048_016740 [Dryococelus australis]|uniref:Uncharacterized protein n=1 Tax=Dryococelus australis TaxID=614101 RepID=A0ABQ9H7M7_9NEOP|nr:hypothetical protein PR048_016740 [Dryococelus australis]
MREVRGDLQRRAVTCAKEVYRNLCAPDFQRIKFLGLSYQECSGHLPNISQRYSGCREPSRSGNAEGRASSGARCAKTVKRQAGRATSGGESVTSGSEVCGLPASGLLRKLLWPILLQISHEEEERILNNKVFGINRQEFARFHKFGVRLNEWKFTSLPLPPPNNSFGISRTLTFPKQGFSTDIRVCREGKRGENADGRTTECQGARNKEYPEKTPLVKGVGFFFFFTFPTGENRVRRGWGSKPVDLGGRRASRPCYTAAAGDFEKRARRKHRVLKSSALCPERLECLKDYGKGRGIGEGIGHGLCLGAIPAFAWNDFGKPWKTEIRIAADRDLKPGSSRMRVHAGMKGRGKWEIPEKTRRSTAFCGTIPTCENPGKRPVPNKEVPLLLLHQVAHKEQLSMSLLKLHVIRTWPESCNVKLRVTDPAILVLPVYTSVSRYSVEQHVSYCPTVLANGVRSLGPGKPYCKVVSSERGRGGLVVHLLASHQDGCGYIPGGVAPGFPHIVIAPVDAAGRRVFSGISRFPPPHFSILTSLYPHRLSRPRCNSRTNLSKL